MPVAPQAWAWFPSQASAALATRAADEAMARQPCSSAYTMHIAACEGVAAPAAVVGAGRRTATCDWLGGAEAAGCGSCCALPRGSRGTSSTQHPRAIQLAEGAAVSLPVHRNALRQGEEAFGRTQPANVQRLGQGQRYVIREPRTDTPEECAAMNMAAGEALNMWAGSGLVPSEHTPDTLRSADCTARDSHEGSRQLQAVLPKY